MEIIERELLLNDEYDEQTQRHTDRQTNQVDDAEWPVAKEIANGSAKDTL
jgi:hypothetical protein